jgi:hypothetical protein
MLLLFVVTVERRGDSGSGDVDVLMSLKCWADE